MKKVFGLSAFLWACFVVGLLAAYKLPPDRVLILANKLLSQATDRNFKPPLFAKRLGDVLYVEQRIGGLNTYVVLGEIRDIDGVPVIFQNQRRIGLFIPNALVDAKR